MYRRSGANLLCGTLCLSLLALLATGCDDEPFENLPDPCNGGAGRNFDPTGTWILSGEGFREGCGSEDLDRLFSIESTDPIAVVRRDITGVTRFDPDADGIGFGLAEPLQTKGEVFRLAGAVVDGCLDFDASGVSEKEAIAYSFRGVPNAFGEIEGTFTGSGPGSCDVRGEFKIIVRGKGLQALHQSSADQLLRDTLRGDLVSELEQPLSRARRALDPADLEYVEKLDWQKRDPERLAKDGRWGRARARAVEAAFEVSIDPKDERLDGSDELTAGIRQRLDAEQPGAKRCSDLKRSGECASMALLLDGRRLMAAPSSTDLVAVVEQNGDVSDEVVPDTLADAEGFASPATPADAGASRDGGDAASTSADAGADPDPAGACDSLCSTIAAECGSPGSCQSDCEGIEGTASLLGFTAEVEVFVGCCEQLAFPAACADAAGFQVCLDSDCERPNIPGL